MKLKVAVSGTTELRIRTQANTSGPWKGFLTTGTQVVVIKLENGFYKLEDGRGWIGKRFTKIIEDLEAKKPTAPKPTPPAKPATPSDTAKQPDKSLTDPPKPKEPEPPKPPSISGKNGLVTGKPIPDDKSLSLITMGRPEGFGVYDYKIDTSFIDSNMDIVRKNLNIAGRKDYASIRMNLFDRFNRYKVAFPEMQLSKTTSYVFFTRPDINLIKVGANQTFSLNEFAINDPLFMNVHNSNSRIIPSLTKDFSKSHDFLPFLSNYAESFELSDEFIKTVETGETLTGYKMLYGKHNIESLTAGTFSINYTDDKDLSVYKTHKVWMEYISKVYRGEVSPRREYIIKRILDYACSAYYFLCAADGETILFWSKYFGVFPTNTPSSALGWAKGSNVKIPGVSINYAYWTKEDYNPLALAEFNMNSGSGDYVYRKVYEPLLYAGGRTFSGAPFIDTTKNDTTYVHKLRFRK